MQPRIKSILVSKETPVREAMRIINESVHVNPPAPGGIALVVNNDGRLEGIVTDGDIRRFILAGRSIAEPVASAMKANPITVYSSMSAEEMLNMMLQETKARSFRSTAFDKIIVTHEDGTPEDVLTFFELWRRTDVRTRTVAIVGLGYVGLTLALTCAEMGIKVIGVDTDEKVLGQLRSGHAHFYERGLVNLLQKHSNHNFMVRDSFQQEESDIYVICVGTPVDENRNPELGALKGSLAAVAKVLKPYDLVILRSTIPTGTTRRIAIPFLQELSGLEAGRDFFVAFAPERTVEGRALEELRTLPQIVGGYDQTSADLAGKFFSLITPTIVPVRTIEAAELAKLLNNCYRDFTFSFANEIAQFCVALGIDANEVIRAANYGYPRDLIPAPSPGVGGLCLSKDPYILHASARQNGVDLKLPLVSRSVNQGMVRHVCERIEKFLATHQKNAAKIFAVGLAFKGVPETTDLRNSTALEIAQILSGKHKVVLYDPIVPPQDLESFGSVVSLADGFRGADAVLVLNNHPSYQSFAVCELAEGMSKPGLFFDAWNLFGPLRESFPEGVHYETL